jgi:hypothetical protein
MAPRPPRAPRGAQKWILAELRTLKSGDLLSTSQLAKRVRKASGTAFHKNSIYNALRLLVKRGAIDVTRSGRNKTYGVRGAGAPRTRDASAVGGTSFELTNSDPFPPAGAFPHKLALGEILVIRVGDGEVLTATNLHGRLVLERHPIPS